MNCERAGIQSWKMLVKARRGEGLDWNLKMQFSAQARQDVTQSTLLTFVLLLVKVSIKTRIVTVEGPRGTDFLPLPKLTEA